MNIKQILLAALIVLISFGFFFSCDVIDEDEYFIPVYTERFVLTELIADAQNIDESVYNDYTSLSGSNNFAVSMVALSGDTAIEGNTLASNQMVSNYSLNTTDSLCMINRSMSGSSYGIAKSAWSTKLTSELAKQGEFTIELEGAYVDSTSTYSGNYSVISLNGYADPISLSVYTVEDSVTANSVVCMNVLREVDENIKIASSISRNETSFNGTFSKDFSSYSNPSNNQLIFVLSNSSTSEVLQVSKVKIEANDNGGNNGGITYPTQKNVLIEDFTGHQCTFCPRAHRELKRLQDLHGSKVVGMAIHYGYQASVDTWEDFLVDYTSTVGTTIGDYFADQNDPLPFGFVNRINNNDDYKYNYGEWDALVANMITETLKASIYIDAQIESGNVEANIHVKAFEEITDQIKVQGFITESHMFSKQKDSDEPTGYKADYEQNHVLRASINGLWGEDLTTAPFAQDQEVTKTYSYTLNSEWAQENLSLIVVIYNDVTKEIIQVEETHLDVH